MTKRKTGEIINPRVLDRIKNILYLAQMEHLELPEYDCNIKKVRGELFIFDPIRRKYLVLSPEEWVRQQFLRHLLQEYNYPRGLINTESALRYSDRLKRSDILVYGRRAQAFFLIECKSMQVPISQDTLNQVCTYNHILKAPYLAVYNGIQYQAYRFDLEKEEYEVFKGIPAYPVLSENKP